MTTWITLLRGINLWPRNKIAMAELREVLAGLGHGTVGRLIAASRRCRDDGVA